LSLWIATGTPYSLIVASKSGCTISLPVSPSNPWQRSKYRLYPSLIVNGVHFTPSPVRNHPLKSVHHTSLLPPYALAPPVPLAFHRRRPFALVNP
jgi:hypothetical protein